MTKRHKIKKLHVGAFLYIDKIKIQYYLDNAFLSSLILAALPDLPLK